MAEYMCDSNSGQDKYAGQVKPAQRAQNDIPIFGPSNQELMDNLKKAAQKGMSPKQIAEDDAKMKQIEEKFALEARVSDEDLHRHMDF